MSKSVDLPKDIEAIHQDAVKKNQQTYIDPSTGYTVFTELAHLKRGFCCGNKCRHCPYNHQNVVKPSPPSNNK
jgi:Family of unknown function (DUF5522)